MDKKVTNSLSIEAPKGFIDEGDGVVSFPDGLTITDGSVQRNGTAYDIESLDITQYGRQLTGDHEDRLSNLIGEVIGVTKRNGRVTIDKIRYAVKENPYARLAYDLLIGGFSKNFSTETIGLQPGSDGVWRNSELVGLSQVVTQNNYNAHINKVVHNSLERAKQDGLDVAGIEEKLLHTNNNHVEDEHKMEENKDKKIEDTEKNKSTAVENQEVNTDEGVSQSEKVETDNSATTEKVIESEKNDNDQEKDESVKKDENGVSVERTTTVVTSEYEYIESEEEKAERLAREAKWEAERAAEIEAEKTPEVVVVIAEAQNDVSDDSDKDKNNNTEEKMDENKKVETQNSLTAETIAELMKNALAPLTSRLDTIEEAQQNAFDKSAKEPAFKKEGEEVAKNSLSDLAFEDRYQKQVDAAWNAVKLNDPKAWKTLNEINQYNLEGLKKAGVARNSITLDDLGNFVIPEEMYREIQGHRNDYSGLLNATEWRETLSLEFAWSERVGDINMQSVAIGSSLVDEDGPVSDDARLKPISEYSTIPRKSQLEELAAVTVVATSATRFFAADLLADAAQGYRTDYDRKRAQLVIAKLEGAIDETGFSVPYNPSNDVDALTTWLDAVTEISDTTLNGTLIFNARTFAELKSRALKAGANGPLSEILTTGEMPTVFGYRFIVVPNDLMPSLGGTETISHIVDGETKIINHAVFFAELSTFTGRTSGGLQYDISNDASYEVNGVTRSAYQRNELVLRGSFYRGGAVRDRQVVAGIRQGNSANVS